MSIFIDFALPTDVESVHVPPFMHGFDLHSSLSFTQLKPSQPFEQTHA
jgi:hypothetical protein